MTQKRLWISVGIFLAIVLLAWRWSGRGRTEADDQNHPLASAETIAAVARAERHTVGNTLNIAGEFKPFQAVDVHAKVAGYIKVIHVDVGDHVKAGQTRAVLEMPELAAELAGAPRTSRSRQRRIPGSDIMSCSESSAPSAIVSIHARLLRHRRTQPTWWSAQR